MSTAKAGTKTYPPKVLIKSIEQLKYERMWSHDEYRACSPGEQTAQIFLEQAKPLKDSTCIDFGCGTGRGGLMVALFGNMVVTLLDFAENALDEEVINATITQPHRISWLQADLTKHIPVTAAYGFCTDVMEHFPPEEVDAALNNMFAAANHIFFQISCVDDNCGRLEGEQLHLTIKPFKWWVKKLRKHGATIHWSHDADGQACLFYVSTWAGHDSVEIEGDINTASDEIISNMKINAKTDYQLIHPHKIQEAEVMMLGGGPSLADYTDEIIKQRAQGMFLITTNGTYNWAIENGMTPSMQLVIDARKFNKRFVRPIVENCKYMMASQCNPGTLEGLPLDRTYIWHCTMGEDVHELLDELYEIWCPCPGGSTVTLRGLCLLRMLGFHKIHMYGFDSCYRDDEHHAYSQPENNYGSKPFPVTVGGKVFWCDAWMFSQAREFMQMVGMFGDEIDLDVKGDGLIAHIIKTGAMLSALERDEE